MVTAQKNAYRPINPLFVGHLMFFTPATGNFGLAMADVGIVFQRQSDVDVSELLRHDLLNQILLVLLLPIFFGDEKPPMFLVTVYDFKPEMRN